MLDNLPRWVAFYTAPRAEKQVLRLLERDGRTAYLPLQRKLQKWHDRKKWVDFPLFNSYIFVKIKAQELWHVRNTQGIVKPVCFGGEVSTIPEREIDNIKRLLESEKELFAQNISHMKKGSRVKLCSGIFDGMEGELISDNKNGNFLVRIEAISAGIVVQMEGELMQVIGDEKES